MFHEHISPEHCLLEDLKPAPGLLQHVQTQHPFTICILSTANKFLPGTEKSLKQKTKSETANMPQQVVSRLEIGSINGRFLRHLKDTNLGVAAAQSRWPHSGNSQQLSCSGTPVMKHLTLIHGATFPRP